MANWWDEAYNDITKWSVNSDQLNKDRGAYKDAFQVNAAEKGLNYDLASRLMDKSNDQSSKEMQLAADLDRRNTLDLMTGEHQFKVSGMQESNRLSKDYLAAQGVQERASLAEQGYQARSTQEVTNRGMTDVEGLRTAASNYRSDSDRDIARIQGGYGLRTVETQDRGETTRTGMNLASQERQIGMAGNESRRTIETQGEQSRLGIREEGDQSRQTIRTQGDESRRSTAFEREHAADLATRMSRR